MMAAFSIFRFALAHKLCRHLVPLPHQSRHLQPPLLSFDSSSPVSPFEFEVALGWLPQNKPLGEQGLAKLFTRVGILIEEYAELSCANGRDNLSHPSQKSLSWCIYILYIHYISSSSGKSQGIYKSIWVFVSNVDTHCLNRLLQNSLANMVARNERLDSECSSLMMRTNADRTYQGLTITAHLS